MEFHSGVRLKVAKECKNLTWQEIADIVKKTDSAVKKWVKDGISSASIPTIANYFKVDEWVFLNENMSEEDFKSIIFNPSLSQSLPVLIHKFIGNQKTRKSDPFIVKPGSVLISARLFGVTSDGVKDIQFSLNRLNISDAEEAQRSWEKLYMNDTIYISIGPGQNTKNEVIREKIIEIFNEEEFYISAHSKHDFEVSVFKR